ncbi:MAG: hypothetical protein RI925_1040 [Pseudomonadota bacterium]|jgi:glucosamine--fructose-6-phosphate aminotransferase (isomerizing)
MCGIVGAIAQRNVVPILLEGLRRLEYRGYDSVGVAVVTDQGLSRERSTERVAELAEQTRRVGLKGLIGIGHTRWATHGAPCERNAHPHFSNGLLSLVHNGIIENHQPLRERLAAQGYTFESDTDTEVMVHLIHSYYIAHHDLLRATQQALAELHGAYAIGVIAADNPGVLVCARHGSPLLLGLGIEENFFASDVSALLPVTQKVIYLEEGEIARLTLTEVQVFNPTGERVEPVVHVSELSADVAELGAYRHYMQKEIHEQPRALADTLERVGNTIEPSLFGAEAPALFAQVNAVSIIACGTSYHAGLVAKYWLESLAGLPTSVEVASEYRYRDSVANPSALVVTISQSGETADTLAALKHAKALGHDKTLSICNVPESSLIRLSALRFLTHAGPEIGVASTKAFTTQLVALYLLTLSLAKVHGRLSAERETGALADLKRLPGAVQTLLGLEAGLEQWSEALATRQHALFLGRHTLFPIALEGALKLKEISYIHAEAYPAGELKHGPLALVDRDMPIIVCAPNDALFDKLASNMQEVRARNGELFVLSDAAVEAGPGQHVLALPVGMRDLNPLLYTIPLQLLAYHTAIRKGTDVDKPRNLAKSVTVE